MSSADTAASDISSAETVCPTPLGCGAGVPLIGISPASADIEKRHINVVVVRNRFIGILLAVFDDARLLT